MVKTSGKILIVDDNEDLLLAARLFLKQHFSLVHTETDPEKIPSLMKNENYDVILLDMNFTMDATSGVEVVVEKEPAKLARQLARLLTMDEVAVPMANSGRQFVADNFDTFEISTRLSQFYNSQV